MLPITKIAEDGIFGDFSYLFASIILSQNNVGNIIKSNNNQI